MHHTLVWSAVVCTTRAGDPPEKTAMVCGTVHTTLCSHTTECGADGAVHTTLCSHPRECGAGYECSLRTKVWSGLPLWWVCTERGVNMRTKGTFLVCTTLSGL